MTETTAFSVRGKRVTVVGAARSGIAAAELLVRRGATVTLTDVRESLEQADELRASGVTLELGGHRDATFTEADLVVLSPGVPSRQPVIEHARQAGIPVIGELEPPDGHATILGDRKPRRGQGRCTIGTVPVGIPL